MPRKGRFLEILVKHLQEFLGPQGLEVKSPELFYQNGKLVGEIDVTVRGKFGSSTIFVGIECRDRPKDRPQGVPWLTQIRGKQQLFKANKMIAVSTTGFVPEAIKVAEDFGMDLLTVDNEENLDLADWFHTIDFFWSEETYEISGLIEIDTEPRTVKGILSVKKDTPFLRLDASKGLISLNEFMKPDLDNLFKSLPNTDSGVVQAEAVIEGTGQIDAELEGKRFKITGLAIPIRLWREVTGGRLLLNICKNIHQNEVVAVTGTGTLETSKRKFTVLAIAKKGVSDTNLRDLRLSFLTEDDQPYAIPAGTTVTLYGKDRK